MSKSRLEKFLYALYSLDSSDLPTPLSRIEELYKCLVTGEEAPTFEPISRVEKYLMAILGGYDVDSLPNPLSRVEVLLHKLATGDDSLEDFDTFLSEHEELLAGIIRNGGVGGNIDIEYVLYTLSTKFNTLYNTAEKPVKSVILKGNTLVNMVEKQNFVGGGDTYNLLFTLDVPVKLNTTYTAYISLNCADKIMTTKEGVFRIKKDSNAGEDLIDIIQFDPDDTTSSTELKVTIQNVDCEYFHIRSYNFKIENMLFMLLEGDHSSEDIPYFEGMSSVKMPVLTTVGKNLFNKELIVESWVDSSTGIDTGCEGCYVPIRVGGAIAISGYTPYYGHPTYVYEYDGNGKYIGRTSGSSEMILNLNKNTELVKVGFYKGTVEHINSLKIQVEKGTQATPYEPCESNILTVNEDVVLCGIGDVKDELDLVTGEVTQRIGEVVFDGSEDWVQSSYGANSSIFYTSFNNLVHKGDYLNSVICDKLMVYANHDDLYHYSTSPNGISAYNDYYDTYPNENWFYIKYTDSEGSVENLKQWLSQNPVTVRYELATESVKTVDLSVVDQDGNDTELSTFNDITHVILSSEGLIPEAELEVATKNEEVLSTLSLEMDDISTTQNDLQETSNTQSENVDATMIATTEIYEQLL